MSIILALPAQKLVLNAFATLTGTVPSAPAFAHHVDYINTNGDAAYIGFLNSVAQGIPVPTLAARLLDNLGLGAVFTQAEAEAYLNSNLSNLGGAIVAVADATLNYVSDPTFPANAEMLAAQAAWVNTATSALNYASNPANVNSTQLTGNAQGLTLTTGFDNLTGTGGDDTFNAFVVQNNNGEQTNQLGTGDTLNGGAGDDTLSAIVQAASALNDGPNAGIAPITVDVEAANFTALDADESNQVVLINAKFMNGLDEVGSIGSDVDLIVQNLNTLTDSGVYADRRNTSDMSIRFDHGGNDAAIDPAADMVVLFDNDYLLSDASSTSSLEIRMVNNLTLANDNQPLVSVDALSFSVGGVQVITEITEAMQALTGAAAYQAVADAINAQLALQNITGVTATLLPERTTVFSDDVGGFLQGTLAGNYSPVLVTSTEGALTIGLVQVDNTTTNFNGLNTQTTASTTAENPIAVDVDLLKVGRGGEGGELIIGGMATDLENQWDFTANALEEGVEVFNMQMEGDRTQFSSLAGLASTNNTLDTVNVEWDAESRADLIIGNQNTEDNRAAGSAVSIVANNPVDGFNNVTTVFNNALKDVRVFNAANNGVTAAVGSAAAISTDVTLWAHLSDEVVAKYMDRTDVDANPAADNADFAYTFGLGNDTLNLNISQGNLAASGTTNREDFSLTINMGNGDNTVVTQIGDGQDIAGAAAAWYVNSKIQDNLTITTGTGADTVHVNGAGAWIINTGAGDDVVYSDNSGRQVTLVGESTAVWVFNTADQAQAAVLPAQRALGDLVSAAAVTSVDNVANLQLTVSYRGITSTVEVGGTTAATGGTVNDLVINQAIKDAINNDVYLQNLLFAQDGPGRTLVVTSIADGVFDNDDIAISVSNSAALSVGQTNEGAALITAAQLTALGLTGGAAVADGRFDSALANDGAADIVGAASAQANANNISAGLGNDTVVLSTSGLDTETVNVAAAGGTALTDSDVVFNATNAVITVDEFDTVIASNGETVSGFAGTVIVNLGSAGVDTIEGGVGNDILSDGLGADTIAGGAGLDAITLIVDAAIDTIILGDEVAGALDADADTITGFVAGSGDLIALSKVDLGAAFASAVGAGFTVATDFVTIAGGVATAATDRVIYDSTSGQLTYDADGVGAGAAVLLATLVGTPVVTAADFVVVA